MAEIPPTVVIAPVVADVGVPGNVQWPLCDPQFTIDELKAFTDITSATKKGFPKSYVTWTKMNQVNKLKRFHSSVNN
jgi:hypothetical protein